MLVPRQQYPRELKIATMRELDSGKSMAEVARMYQVSPNRKPGEASGEPRVSWHFLVMRDGCSRAWMRNGFPSWNAKSGN